MRHRNAFQDWVLDPAQKAKVGPAILRRRMRLAGPMLYVVSIAVLIVLLVASAAVATPAGGTCRWAVLDVDANDYSGTSTVTWVLVDENGELVTSVPAYGNGYDAATSERQVVTVEGTAWTPANVVGTYGNAFVRRVTVPGSIVWAGPAGGTGETCLDEYGEPINSSWVRRNTTGRTYYQRVEDIVALGGDVPDTATVAWDPSNGYLAAVGGWAATVSTHPLAGRDAPTGTGSPTGGRESEVEIEITDPDDTVIIGDENPTSTIKVVQNMLYTAMYDLAGNCMGIAGWALTLMNPATMFDVDLEGGTWAPFWTLATDIANRVAVPFGTALIVIMMIANLARIGDERGEMPQDLLFRTFVMYAIAWTCVAHATEIFWAIYWMGRQLLGFVNLVLADSPMDFATVGDSLSSAIRGEMEQVTYSDWGLGILYVVVAVIACVVCVSTTLKVLAFAILRMCEIYLRLAFGGITFAYALSQQGRQATIEYVKRFAACVAQAAVVVVALAFGAQLIELAPTLIAIVDMPEGIVGTIARLLPTITVLGCIGTLIDKAQGVTSNLFHVMPNF